MQEKSHYNKKHKDLARRLRQEGTLGEQILWTEVLHARKFYGYQFNRQFPIDKYIVDFICRKLHLVVEVDGYSHAAKYNADKERDERLSELGYVTVRFTESEVRNNIENIVRVLESYLPN